jgi:hypothetical protein
MDDETIIVCKRAGPEGPYTNSIVSSCNKCGHPIWISKSTPIIEGARFLCIQCVPWNEVTDIAPPTMDQMSDVLRFRNRGSK